MHANTPAILQTRAALLREILALVVAGLFSTGCRQGAQPDANSATEPTPSKGSVVVYSALDREFAEPILNDQASKAGVSLRAKFDVESTKTVGLTNMLIAEAVQPRCDLFWNNEILNTMRLKERGLLQAVSSGSCRRIARRVPGPGRNLVWVRRQGPDPGGQHAARPRGRPAARGGGPA